MFVFMKILRFAISIFILCSCNNQKPSAYADCKDFNIEWRRVTDRTHILVLRNYHDECFSLYDFVKQADRYIDTLTNNRPVEVIYFCKPVDKIEHFRDSRDFDLLR